MLGDGQWQRTRPDDADGPGGIAVEVVRDKGHRLPIMVIKLVYTVGAIGADPPPLFDVDLVPDVSVLETGGLGFHALDYEHGSS